MTVMSIQKSRQYTNCPVLSSKCQDQLNLVEVLLDTAEVVKGKSLCNTREESLLAMAVTRAIVIPLVLLNIHL